MSLIDDLEALVGEPDSFAANIDGKIYLKGTCIEEFFAACPDVSRDDPRIVIVPG